MVRKPVPSAAQRQNEDAERFEPGGAASAFREVVGLDTPDSQRRRLAYGLLESMSSAMRERADDQSRSTDRSETPSASAASRVVKPAK